LAFLTACGGRELSLTDDAGPTAVSPVPVDRALSCVGQHDGSSWTCSDDAAGHAYVMSCARTPNGQADCACNEDGKNVKTFSTAADVLGPASTQSAMVFTADNGCAFPLSEPVESP
jgi:hypothetical protein